jgi:uracil-DNA glycosylase
MTIQEYFGDWCKVINLTEANTVLKKLVASKQPVYPNIKDIFKDFTLCPLHNLRVVIMGQDPSTSPPYFSPSLEVLMESVIDFSLPHGSVNFDPSLEKWESQGVLMLNSALSCNVGKVGSHVLLWKPFIRSLLTNLSLHTNGVVYVLMGSEAQSFESCINSKYNYVLKTRHPSWYAKNNQVMPSDLWTNINSILIGQNGYGIEWYETK